MESQKSIFVLYMPTGALFFFKKSIFVLYMPAGAVFFLKKSGFALYMPAGAWLAGLAGSTGFKFARGTGWRDPGGTRPGDR